MLTTGERKAILAGQRASIERPADAPCPVGIGDRLTVHPQFTVEVTNFYRRSGKWRIMFICVDHRPRLLHRNSSHGYTTTEALAMSDEPEAVPRHFQDRLSREAQAKTALSAELQRVRGERVRLERNLQDARLKGKTGRVRNLMSRMQRLDSRLEAVA